MHGHTRTSIVEATARMGCVAISTPEKPEMGQLLCFRDGTNHEEKRVLKVCL